MATKIGRQLRDWCSCGGCPSPGLAWVVNRFDKRPEFPSRHRQRASCCASEAWKRSMMPERDMAADTGAALPRDTDSFRPVQRGRPRSDPSRNRQRDPSSRLGLRVPPQVGDCTSTLLRSISPNDVMPFDGDVIVDFLLDDHEDLT